MKSNGSILSRRAWISFEPYKSTVLRLNFEPPLTSSMPFWPSPSCSRWDGESVTHTLPAPYAPVKIADMSTTHIGHPRRMA